MRTAFLLLLIAFPLRAADRPNVLVLLSDDQGWGDLSINGNTNLSTPHIDSIGKNGAVFDRFYVCPVCSPTRAEFLTGRYHLRCGVRNVTSGGERLNLDEKTIADHFKAAGYATGCFGKWHNGSQYPYHPLGRGFEEYYGFTSGHWGDYFSPPLDHNGRAVKGEGFLADDLTTKAMDHMAKSHAKGKPFFTYVAFNTPHSPMQVPDKYWDRFKGKALAMLSDNAKKEDLDFTRAALAMCENIDDNVGRLLKKLEELKIADNTIVFYFSDNGPNSFRWNGGMKGRKASTDEGGVRSPLVMKWPGKIKPGTKVEGIAGAIDLLPSLASMCGVKLEGGKSLDGIDVSPQLLEGKAADKARLIFNAWNGNTSVRSQTFRLDNTGQLFDMVKDPGQKRNVAKAEALTAEILGVSLAKWKKEVGGLGKDERPFPVGYKEMPVTNLPARDGVPHGGVARSERAPNCSYFTNWTKPGDSMTWAIEVATAGKYEVEILHTISKENLGAEVELSFKANKIAGKPAEAHDPPIYGMENDRVKRVGESYMKDFKPMKLGVMDLEKGSGELTLKALKIPGKGVMDVRGIVLTLTSPANNR